jgi:hypothetical protein
MARDFWQWGLDFTPVLVDSKSPDFLKIPRESSSGVETFWKRLEGVARTVSLEPAQPRRVRRDESAFCHDSLETSFVDLLIIPSDGVHQSATKSPAYFPTSARWRDRRTGGNSVSLLICRHCSQWDGGESAGELEGDEP